MNKAIHNFNDFKKLVLEKHPKYNQNYLQAEYQTAKASGQMAAKWEGFQRNKARYPYLKYMTVGDEHVRDDHKELHGFIAHIDDAIWDRIYPPNDWRCRCYVVQTNQEPTGEAPDLSFMKPEFSVNVGKTGTVFNDQAHPYFIIPKKDEKRMKLAFESMKLRLAYGKAKHTANNGAKVYVHPFADPSDLLGNYRAAVKIASKGISSKLCPHSNIKGSKNPEFNIANIKGDRVVPISTNLKRGISNAFDSKLGKKKGVSGQLRDLKDTFMIIDLSFYELTNKKIGDVTSQSWQRFNHYSTINYLIFIYKDNVVKVNRSVLKKGYDAYAKEVFKIGKGD